MHSGKMKIQDTDLEKIIGQILRFGVLLSSVVVVTGGILYLVRHGFQTPSYGSFKAEPEKMRNPFPMWKAILHGEGRPMIAFGLLLLILTPIARIVFSIAGYFLERDWLYVAITAVVLVVILWNL